jgi:hypothetical protein
MTPHGGGRSRDGGKGRRIDCPSTMPAIASTGAMLFTGHKGTSGKSALARRIISARLTLLRLITASGT